MMTTEQVPEGTGKDFLSNYRGEVRSGIMRNLRNIYIYNIKAYCQVKEVKNAAQMSLLPDERYMTAIEDAAEITKEQSDIWRHSIWRDIQQENFQRLDQRLDPVFTRLAGNFQLVQKALIIYPNDINLGEGNENAED